MGTYAWKQTYKIYSFLFYERIPLYLSLSNPCPGYSGLDSI
ncbi:hypothetical protein ABOONEI_2592 [Aciduliprofundum boonei T469]|nr:hypothetical protein ABOONEI_2592 [Aciduliprofundum boonei T469]